MFFLKRCIVVWYGNSPYSLLHVVFGEIKLILVLQQNDFKSACSIGLVMVF